jgi:hypothetical protein
VEQEKMFLKEATGMMCSREGREMTTWMAVMEMMCSKVEPEMMFLKEATGMMCSREDREMITSLLVMEMIY